MWVTSVIKTKLVCNKIPAEGILRNPRKHISPLFTPFGVEFQKIPSYRAPTSQKEYTYPPNFGFRQVGFTPEGRVYITSFSVSFNFCPSHLSGFLNMKHFNFRLLLLFDCLHKYRDDVACQRGSISWETHDQSRSNNDKRYRWYARRRFPTSVGESILSPFTVLPRFRASPRLWRKS